MKSEELECQSINESLLKVCSRDQESQNEKIQYQLVPLEFSYEDREILKRDFNSKLSQSRLL